MRGLLGSLVFKKIIKILKKSIFLRNILRLRRYIIKSTKDEEAKHPSMSN
jgi:hypothetical protein